MSAEADEVSTRMSARSWVEEQYQAAVEQRREFERKDRELYVPNPQPPPKSYRRRCDECHSLSDRPAGEGCSYRYVDGCVGTLRSIEDEA